MRKYKLSRFFALFLLVATFFGIIHQESVIEYILHLFVERIILALLNLEMDRVSDA